MFPLLIFLQMSSRAEKIGNLQKGLWCFILSLKHQLEPFLLASKLFYESNLSYSKYHLNCFYTYTLQNISFTVCPQSMVK